MNDKTFVLIGTFSQPHEAHMVQSMLDAEGIASELEGEYTLTANPLWSNAMGGVRLLVAAPDVERASLLLAEYRRNQAETAAKRARTCPQCQGEDVAEIRRPVVVAVLAVLTLGVFVLLVPWPKYKCAGCGNKW